MQISVPEYFQTGEWVLDDVSFTYLGGRYQGRGILTWQADKGFHLETLVARSGPMPAEVKFWQVRLPTKRDRTSIRMRIRHGGRALAIVTLTDRFDVVADARLSCHLDVVRFMSAAPEAARKVDQWIGSALIEVGPSSPLWPDALSQTITLGDLTISRSSALKGLRYETPTLQVRGRVVDGRLALNWAMDKAAYKRAAAWQWARAFHDALSIELGCALPFLERDVFVSPRQHLERVQAGRLVRLDPFHPFESDFVDKSRLFWLTDFFMKGTREAHIARKLFDQMVRARQQTRWNDTELILSTALEGVLRALDGTTSSDQNWKLHDSLARFQKRYLSAEWRHIRKQACAAFERLRHSTAHPDWTVDKTAPSAEAERSQSFNDLRFLSRFYGSMILALAGIPSSQLVFGDRPITPQPTAPAPKVGS